MIFRRNVKGAGIGRDVARWGRPAGEDVGVVNRDTSMTLVISFIALGVLGEKGWGTKRWWMMITELDLMFHVRVRRVLRM